MSLMPIDPPAAPQKQNFGSKLGDILFALATGAPSPNRMRQLVEQKQQREDHSIMQRVMAEAQARAAFPKAAEPTTTQRTYEFMKSLNPAMAETYLSNQAQGAPIAVDSVDPAGNTVRQYMRPGTLGQPQAPAQAPGSDAGTLPPGYAVRKSGGAAPAAGAPFPLRPLKR